GLAHARLLQGSELSFTNWLDVDAARRLVCEFDEPSAAIIKHTNPCGFATGDSAAHAYERAYECDPRAAYGGIVGLNRRLDLLTAWRVCRHVKSNAVVIVAEDMAVGVGAGQMSRVEASELAVARAGVHARGAVAASDAFFPMPDGLETLGRAGVRAVIHPGG